MIRKWCNHLKRALPWATYTLTYSYSSCQTWQIEQFAALQKAKLEEGLKGTVSIVRITFYKCCKLLSTLKCDPCEAALCLQVPLKAEPSAKKRAVQAYLPCPEVWGAVGEVSEYIAKVELALEQLHNLSITCHVQILHFIIVDLATSESCVCSRRDDHNVKLVDFCNAWSGCHFIYCLKSLEIRIFLAQYLCFARTPRGSQFRFGIY